MKNVFKRSWGVLVMMGMVAAVGVGQAFAGPPLATDDAGIVDVGHLEVELNSSYVHDRERVAGDNIRHSVTDGEVKLTTGLLKNADIFLTVPYTFSDRERVNGDLTGSSNGFGDMLLELKYVFFEKDGLALTLKPTMLIPTGKYSAGLSEGRWQFGGALIASKEFEDGKYTLHANLGYEHHDYRTEESRVENRGDLWSASLAGEAKVMKNLTAVLDFGVARSTDASTSTPAAYALVGARYELNEHLDLDCGVKIGLTEPEDDVAALYGIVLKF
ncbi:MAG: transporter [Desulfuromonadales bacterium]|nr:transporter [Desulfuromonadales bacterium]